MYKLVNRNVHTYLLNKCVYYDLLIYTCLLSLYKLLYRNIHTYSAE